MTRPSSSQRPRDLRGPTHAPPSPERDAALSVFTAGAWLLTSCYEGARVGVPTRWAQRAGDEPPLVSVVLPKGSVIAPVIRDSRAFALNLLPVNQPLLARRFSNGMAERLGDPFETVALRRLVTGSPCLCAATVVIDCELFRHVDLEPESEMYVGLVLGARAA